MGKNQNARVMLEQNGPSPRAHIALSCTLRRRAGSPIPARTLELGPRGMCVSSPRPLTPDETMDFDIAVVDMRVSGCARVLRQERPDVYALRFEGLPEAMTRRLQALVIDDPR